MSEGTWNGVALAVSEERLAMLRRAQDDGAPLSTAERLALMHHNAQALRALMGIAATKVEP